MSSTRRLRIAYLCDMSPDLAWTYSGGNQRIRNTLDAHVGDVAVLPQSWGLLEPLRRLMHKLPEALNLRLRWRLHLILGPLVAGPVNRALERGDFDVVFCVYSMHSMAGVRPPAGVPLIFNADATPSVYKASEVGQSFGSYWSFSRLFDGFVARREGQLLRRADALIWPSDWQDQGARQMFDLPADLGHVLPWGANIPTPPKPAVKSLPEAGNPVEFLFVGRDWFAKGGPLVEATLTMLEARGIAVRLTVIGCEPPAKRTFMRVLGHLDKAVDADAAAFEAAFREAHFMFMASYEAYGFAFCEAAAHGLPSICLSLGGVPVRQGETGFTLPPGSEAAEFANLIEAALADEEKYQVISEGSRSYFESSLNWESWAKKTGSLILKLRNEKPV